MKSSRIKHFIEAVEYEYYPEYFLRVATHFTPEGDVIRKEVENYFGGNVFWLQLQKQKIRKKTKCS